MENVNEALYIGVYTMIFVIALSLSVFLFSNLMDYADEAYEYMHAQSNDAVSVTGEVNRYLILSGQEVLSYYYNYIKIDKYTDTSVKDDTVVTINLNTKDEAQNLLTSTNLTYKEVVNKIGMDNKYILSVDSQTNSEVTYITITKATDEELEEMW